MDAIKHHPVIGETIIRPLKGLGDIARIIRSHHERYDGLGYPDRLRGEGIPLEARIMAIADSYDAMTTTRPYRVPLPGGCRDQGTGGKPGQAVRPLPGGGFPQAA